MKYLAQALTALRLVSFNASLLTGTWPRVGTTDDDQGKGRLADTTYACKLWKITLALVTLSYDGQVGGIVWAVLTSTTAREGLQKKMLTGETKTTA
jgi:hypothetical protein